MIHDRYYFSLLSGREQQLYKKIYEAMRAFKKKVTVVCLAPFDLKKIMRYIDWDNPELFYVDFTFSHNDFLIGSEIYLDYYYPIEEIRYKNAEIKKTALKVLKKVSGTTAYEKELQLHDLLIKNIIYDEVALQNREKFKWRSATILGGLIYKAAICEGVAKLMKVLLNALDIECIVAIGKSNDISGASERQDVDHAWNIVKIDDKWYHTDVTFDMGISQKNFVRHDYYNMMDEQISHDHFFENKYPICTETKDNYFIKNKLNLASLSEVTNLIDRAIRNKTNCIYFTFVGKPLEGSRLCNLIAERLKIFIGESRTTVAIKFSNTSNLAQRIYFLRWKISDD